MLKVFFSIIFTLISILLFSLEQYNFGLSAALFAYLLLLYNALRTAGFNSVYFLFLVLFGIYGYSVPVSVYFGVDIGWHRVAKLSTWEQIDDTLYSYLISNQLALLAIQLVSIFFARKRYLRIEQFENREIRLSYYQMAIIAGVFSSISEVINFIRVGGFNSTKYGKAFYQGAVSDLALNIPYEGFLYISAALFSIFISAVPLGVKYFKYVFWYLFSIAFVLFINILIGERGSLVVMLIIFWLGFTLYKRITWVKFKYLLFLPVLYLGFNVITLLREPTISYEGFNEFYNSYKEQLFRLMNPANTEFGSPALNYRIFIEEKPANYRYKFGTTYLELPLAFIPTYIYPDKPKGIIYEFRDQYFRERSKLGSTAGTGFSSLLEAYMNFGFFGPFIIYMICIFILLYFENKRGKKRLFDNLYYLLLFNIFLIFSRTNSQYIFYNVILYLFQSALIVLAYKYLPRIGLKHELFSNGKV